MALMTPQRIVGLHLRQVRERIDAACVAAGRDPATVRVLPVTKTQPAVVVRGAALAGCREFGENRVQEMAAKAAALGDLVFPQEDHPFDARLGGKMAAKAAALKERTGYEGTGLRWVLIGHLQRNKVGRALAVAAEIQSLDSLATARALEEHCAALGRTVDVLVQVNSSGEATKNGLEPGEVAAFTRQAAAFEHLRLRGLMTIALPSDDPAPVEACFSLMETLRDHLRDRDGGGWDELSMGMSHDYEPAIRHGATCVRIGTAIFGQRV